MVFPGLTQIPVSKWTENARKSKKLVIAIVFLALLLDNVLLTVVVPILPDYLLMLEQEDSLAYSIPSDGKFWNITFTNGTHFGAWFYNISPSLNWTHFTWNPVSFAPNAPNDMTSENSKVGWLFSSKAIVQLLANPFVGPLTNRYGYNIPMFTGFVILLISTTMFAFGESYAILFAARAIQGVGSACTAIAGMGMLASTYPDDKERSRAMGVALGGLAMGVLIGYPFGGFMYQFVGKMSPFLIIAVFVLLEGALQVWILQPGTTTSVPVSGTPLRKLLIDPYIIIASGAILFPEMAMAMLEPTLPIWLIETMHPQKWQLGTVFLPDSIGYLIGTNAFGIVAHKLGRWVCTIAALLLMGACLACIPFATMIPHLIMPHFGLGLSLGIVDVSMMPLMALLVDKRHIGVYGSVYAIAQVSTSLAFAIGPSVGGQLVRLVGFPWLIRGMAITNVVYSPLCYLLRDPPTKEENKEWVPYKPQISCRATNARAYVPLDHL